MTGVGAFIKALVKRLNGEIPIKTLIKRWLNVGENFSRQYGCFIVPGFCHLITIGNNVTFSKKCYASCS